MAKAPEGFPVTTTPEAIKKYLSEVSKDFEKALSNTNLETHSHRILLVGQIELQKRMLEEAIKAAEKSGKWAFGVATLSCVLAVLGIYLTLEVSKSDSHWQKELVENQRNTEVILNSLHSDNEKLQEALKNQLSHMHTAVPVAFDCETMKQNKSTTTSCRSVPLRDK